MKMLTILTVAAVIASSAAFPFEPRSAKDVLLQSGPSESSGIEVQSITNIRQGAENNRFIIDGKEIEDPRIKSTVSNAIASALSPLQMFNPSPFGFMQPPPMGFGYPGFPFYHGSMAPPPMMGPFPGPMPVGYVQLPVYTLPTGGFTVSIPSSLGSRPLQPSEVPLRPRTEESTAAA